MGVNSGQITMPKSSASGLKTSPATRAFLVDMQDFFAGRRFAHVGKWRYSEPMFEGDTVNGIEIWNRLTERAKFGGKYYIFSDEVNLIRTCLAEIVEFISEDTAFVDLGPGSQEAILDKVGVILEAASGRIREYVAVDLVPEILVNAKALLARRFPNLMFTPTLGDMFGLMDLPKGRDRFVAIFGQTMFNIAISPLDHAAGRGEILERLSALRRQLRPGEKLVIPQNCSEDREEIEAAYREQAEVWLNLFHRVLRDLPITGAYDPDAFAFEPFWVPSSYILSHSVISTKPMRFELGGKAVSLDRGSRLYLHNTVVYPRGLFEELTRVAGFSTRYNRVNDKGRMALSILEAT